MPPRDYYRTNRPRGKIELRFVLINGHLVTLDFKILAI